MPAHQVTHDNMATENPSTMNQQQQQQRQNALTNSSTEKAKVYIQNREIPQLFEALMTGLMFKQPDDHIDYIIGCLQRLKSSAQKSQVKWNTFLANNGSSSAPNNDLPPLRDNSNVANQAKVINGKPR